MSFEVLLIFITRRSEWKLVIFKRETRFSKLRIKRTDDFTLKDKNGMTLLTWGTRTIETTNFSVQDSEKTIAFVARVVGKLLELFGEIVIETRMKIAV